MRISNMMLTVDVTRNQGCSLRSASRTKHFPAGIHWRVCRFNPKRASPEVFNFMRICKAAFGTAASEVHLSGSGNQKEVLPKT